MPNNTLLAIPPNVTDASELRIFLTKLIVTLDVLIGYRGGETTLVTKEFLTEQLATEVVSLEDYQQTISATYSQTEMQAVSDQVTALTAKINEVISE